MAHDKHKLKLNIYLVANEKALSLLSYSYLVTNLRDSLNGLFGMTLTTIPLDLTKNDSSHIDSRHAYTASYPLTPTPSTTGQHPHKTHSCSVATIGLHLH